MDARTCGFALASLALALSARGQKPGAARLVRMLPLLAVLVFVPLVVPRRSDIVARSFLAGQFTWWSAHKALAFCIDRGPLALCDDNATWFVFVLLMPMSPRKPGEDQAHGSAAKAAIEQARHYAPKAIAKACGIGLLVSLLRSGVYLGEQLTTLVYAFALYFLLGVFEDGVGCVSASLIGLEVERR